MRHDLAADLKAIRAGATVFPDPDPGVRTEYELHEVAEHAIERALRAEEMLRKLKEAAEVFQDEVFRQACCHWCDESCSPYSGSYPAHCYIGKAWQVLLEVLGEAMEVLGDRKWQPDTVLGKIQEVLGDEETCAG